MSDLDLNRKMDRRAFLKSLGIAGATTIVMSVTAEAGSLAGYRGQPPPLADEAPPGMKAVYLYTVGPGGNLNWKPGDAAKFAPAEKIPGGKPADTVAALSKDKRLEIYRTMYTTRKWESALKDAFLKGETYGTICIYVGHEAMASGVMAALNKDDYVVSCSRPGGHIVAKGTDLNKVTAEYYLRATGISKGKGSCRQIADPNIGFLGSQGMIGGAWLLTAGAAYSAIVHKTKQVVVGFSGDNAANSVYFFSAVRNAALYKLPAIFVIENNFQSVFTPMAVTVPTKQISDYTKGLDVPSVTVDGNDVTAVYAATNAAVERARAGLGPSVIEGMTYRWYDHVNFAGAKVGQDGAFGLPYRTDDEVRLWLSRDPILRYRAFLLERNLAAESDLAKIETEVQQAVAAAFEFARTSPRTDPKAGLEGVYMGGGPVPATQFLTI